MKKETRCSCWGSDSSPPSLSFSTFFLPSSIRREGSICFSEFLPLSFFLHSLTILTLETWRAARGMAIKQATACRRLSKDPGRCGKGPFPLYNHSSRPHSSSRHRGFPYWFAFRKQVFQQKNNLLDLGSSQLGQAAICPQNSRMRNVFT